MNADPIDMDLVERASEGHDGPTEPGVVSALAEVASAVEDRLASFEEIRDKIVEALQADASGAKRDRMLAEIWQHQQEIVRLALTVEKMFSGGPGRMSVFKGLFNRGR